MAQDYRFSGFDAPQGANATLNLRVPLGARREQARPTYGLTLSYGRTLSAPTMDGRTVTRAVNVADFRFAGGELRTARVASFDLANLDRDRRMNLSDSHKATYIWILVAIAAAAAGLACVTQFEGFCGGDSQEADPDPTPGNSTG